MRMTATTKLLVGMLSKLAEQTVVHTPWSPRELFEELHLPEGHYKVLQVSNVLQHYPFECGWVRHLRAGKGVGNADLYLPSKFVLTSPASEPQTARAEESLEDRLERIEEMLKILTDPESLNRMKSRFMLIHLSLEGLHGKLDKLLENKN